MVWLPKQATKPQTIKDMKEEFLKTKEGLKYMIENLPSNMPIQAAIAEILTFKLRKAVNETV